MATTVTKTIKSSGGDYTSLSAWEAANQGDLVAADEIRRAECYDLSDTTVLTINGSTTDATRYIDIVGATGDTPGMPYSTASYRLEPASADTALITISDDFVRVRRIQLKVTKSSGTSERYGIVTLTLAAGAQIYIEGVLIQGNIGSGNGDNSRAIYCFDADAAMRISNCVIYDFSQTGMSAIYTVAMTAYLYNNTVVNCLVGYRGGGTSVVAINNLYDSQGLSSADGFNNTFAASSNFNCSDLSSDAPGANSRNSQTTTYVDEANDDFHLGAADASAKDFGTDLSGDANYAISIDFDGETRSGSWDIGADEIVSAVFTKITAEAFGLAGGKGLAA